MTHVMPHTLTCAPEIPAPDRWGRYRFPHPEKNRTTILQAWTRTTTLIKAISDTYHLDEWKHRSILKGLALRPELVARASMMDVKADKKDLAELIEKALEASGANTKRELGTALHDMTEAYDWDTSYGLTSVPTEYVPRILQYAAAIEAHGMMIASDMIERAIVSTRFQAGGKFDRVGRLSDGTYAVLDLKTSSNLDFGHKEIAAQLAVYADGFNAHGVWDGKQMTRPPYQVRTDFGYVIHLPSDGDGCRIYEVELEPGREWAAECLRARTLRSDRKDPFRLLTGDPCVDPYSVGPADAGDTWEGLLAGCNTRDELVAVMQRARAKGEWTDRLAGWAKSYARAIELGQAHAKATASGVMA